MVLSTGLASLRSSSRFSRDHGTNGTSPRRLLLRRDNDDIRQQMRYQNAAAVSKAHRIAQSCGDDDTAIVYHQQQIGGDLVGAAAEDAFGQALAMSADGMVLAAGVPYEGTADSGLVQVFRWNNNNAGGGRFQRMGQDIYGLTSDGGELFGFSVALSSSGTILAVGAVFSGAGGVESGQVAVWKYNNETVGWTQRGAAITGQEARDRIGQAVALSANGDVLAVGAIEPYQGDEETGYVQVYGYNTTIDNWVQLGSDINGEGGLFGLAVDLSDDGTVLGVGAPRSSDFSDNNGKVAVFKYTQETGWNKRGADLSGVGWFGAAVALSSDGATIAVGAYTANGHTGFVLVFEFTEDSNWIPMGQPISGEAEGDQSGNSLSLSADGTMLAIGARFNGNTGHVRLWRYGAASGTWTKLGDDLDGKTQGGGFGHSVRLSSDGSILAVRGEGESNKGYIRVFNITSSCGTPEPTSSPSVPVDASSPLPAPSSYPTPEPTPALTTHNPSTSPLTTTPEAMKTKTPTALQDSRRVAQSFSGISMNFGNAGRLNESELRRFEIVTEEWFKDFFTESKAIQEMNTEIQVVDQNVALNENQAFPVNTITYDQSVQYIALDNARAAKDYVLFPFFDEGANMRYAEILALEFPAFQRVQTPLLAPELSSKSSSSPSLSMGIVVGAVVGGAVILVLAGYLGLKCWRNKLQHENPGTSTSSADNAQTGPANQIQARDGSQAAHGLLVAVHDRVKVADQQSIVSGLVPARLEPIGYPVNKDQVQSATAQEDVEVTPPCARPVPPENEGEHERQVRLAGLLPRYKDQTRPDP